jgi:dihydrofolate reductase
MKIEGILAHNTDYVIGSGDIIPWHHSGDFKRFKTLTTGHSLLMGARTFLGIARNYFAGDPTLPEAQRKVVLPGRTIFVVGKPKNPLGNMDPATYRNIHKRGYGNDWTQLVHEILDECRQLGVSNSNIRMINEDTSPQGIIDRIEMNYLQRGETLFIAGGAKLYHNYLPLAQKIHQTIVYATPGPASMDLVSLTPEIIHYLKDQQLWVTTIDEGFEMSNGLKAEYKTISKLS